MRRHPAKCIIYLPKKDALILTHDPKNLKGLVVSKKKKDKSPSGYEKKNQRNHTASPPKQADSPPVDDRMRHLPVVAACQAVTPNERSESLKCLHMSAKPSKGHPRPDVTLSRASVSLEGREESPSHMLDRRRAGRQPDAAATRAMS